MDVMDEYYAKKLANSKSLDEFVKTLVAAKFHTSERPEDELDFEEIDTNPHFSHELHTFEREVPLETIPGVTQITGTVFLSPNTASILHHAFEDGRAKRVVTKANIEYICFPFTTDYNGGCVRGGFVIQKMGVYGR